MIFGKRIFDFIDALSILDTFCIVVAYVMYALLIVNIWSNFSFVKFAKCLHVTIFSFILFTDFCFYLYDKDSFVTLFSNVFVDIVLVSSLLIYLVYLLYNTHIGYSIKQLVFNRDSEDKQDDEKNNYSHKKSDVVNVIEYNNEICSQKPCAEGVYCDYKYYYNNIDRYAEPHTTPVKAKSFVTRNLSKDFAEKKTYNDQNNFVIGNGINLTDISLSHSENNCKEMTAEKLAIKKSDHLISNALNMQNYQDTSGGVNIKEELKEKQDLYVNISKELEKNFLNKINKRFAQTTENIEDLKKCIQDVVDRIAQLSEALVIAFQKNKKTGIF